MASETPHTLHTFKTSHTSLNSTDGGSTFKGKRSQKLTHVDEDAREKPKLEVQNLSTATESEQDQCSANRSGGVEKAIYRTGSEADDIDSGFLEFIRCWLGSIPPERDRALGDALAYILKQESSGHVSVLNCRAKEWQAQARQQVDTAQVRESLGLISGQKPPESLDLGEVLADIRSQLKRLSWTAEDAIAHMIKHCGWSASHPASKYNTFDPLTDEDLIALLEELRRQLTGGKSWIQ